MRDVEEFDQNQSIPISHPKLAVALQSMENQAKLSKEHKGQMHQQKLPNNETLTVTQQSYSEKEKEVFRKIADMKVNNHVDEIATLAFTDPSSKEETKKIDSDIYRMFYQNTKMGSLGAAERYRVFKSLQSIFKENPDNPHLSNQMVKFINAKRNALDFKREFNIGGKPFTETTVGIANLGHGKKGGVEIAMESTLDSLDKKDKKTENPLHTSKEPSDWTFPKETEYKTAITSLVDSSLAGVGGETSMSQRTVDAAEKINKEYDAAKKRLDTRGNQSRGVKFFLGQIRRRFGYMPVAQKDTEKQDREIINRGKVVVTRGAAYNTVAQSGNWSTGNKNAEAKALIESQNKHMDALVSKIAGVSEQKSVVAKFCTTLRQTALGLTEEEKKQKEDKESVRQDLRQLLANNMGLDKFKEKHNCKGMPDADLQKLALYAGRREVFEASKGFKKQFGAQTLFGKPTNNHIFHLAAATGMMKSMFGDHALEGCKSNKDRASMVRMMQMSMDRAMMQDPNWKLPKNPDQVTKAVSKDPLVLTKEEVTNEKDKDIKNMEALSERFRELHYDQKGNYDPYLSKVTAANAVGSEGALAHSETGVAGDSNNRAMMPAAFSAIYKVTRPDFLVRKQIDGFTADFNKGPKYEYVANAQKEAERVEKKFTAEKKKFNERFKNLEGEPLKEINAAKAAIENNASYKDVLKELPSGSDEDKKAVLDYRTAYLENEEWGEGMKQVKKAFLKSFEQLALTADKGVLDDKKILTENRDVMTEKEEKELDKDLDKALFSKDKERPKKLRELAEKFEDIVDKKNSSKTAKNQVFKELAIKKKGIETGTTYPRKAAVMKELLAKHGKSSDDEKKSVSNEKLEKHIGGLLQRTGTRSLMTEEGREKNAEKNKRVENLIKTAKDYKLLDNTVVHKGKPMSVAEAIKTTTTRSEAIDLLKNAIDVHVLNARNTSTERHSSKFEKPKPETPKTQESLGKSMQ